MGSLIELPVWQDLQKHASQVQALHLRDLFAADANRAQQFSVEAEGLFLDYAKYRIT